MQEINKILIDWIKNEVARTKSSGVVFEITPKLESAVIAALAKKAFPEKCLGLVLPYLEKPENEQIVSDIIEAFDIPVKKADLNIVLNELLSKLEGPGFRFPPPWDFVAAHNVAPRLRNASLYYFANKMNYLVLGNITKLHIYLGNYTKYGNGAADIMPLGDMYYCQIKSLAQDMDIPEKIVEYNFDHDILKNETGDAELGLTYEDLDNIIQSIEQNESNEYDSRVIKTIRERNRAVKHKRSMPKVFKLEVDNLSMSDERFDL